MHKSCLSLSFFLLLILAGTVAQAQDFQNYSQINYTIEEGLPSNECHQLLQDSLGYIWIATDRGLVRYDGYEFKTYGIQDGLKDISCLVISIDKNQNIWILTFSGRIYKYDPSLDACVAYEYQSKLDALLRVTNISDLAISDDLTLSFLIVGVGILDISESGQTEFHRGEFVAGEANFTTKTINETILIVGVARDGSPNYEERDDIKFEYINGEPSDIFQVQHKGLNTRGLHDVSMHTSSNMEAFPLLDGIDLLSLYGVNYFFESDTVFIRKHQSEIEDIIVVNDSSFISSEVNHKGVNFYKNYTALLCNEKSSLIEGVSSTSNLLDTDGNLWVSTLDQGLFKLEQKQVKLPHQSVRNTGRITNIEIGDQGIYYTKEKNEVYTSRFKSKDSLILFDASNRILSLTYDEYSGDLIISKDNSLIYSDKKEFSKLKYIYKHCPLNIIPCLLYTSPSPRDATLSRMPSSA